MRVMTRALAMSPRAAASRRNRLFLMASCCLLAAGTSSWAQGVAGDGLSAESPTQTASEQDNEKEAEIETPSGNESDEGVTLPARGGVAEMDEIVVTPTASPQRAFEAPYSLNVVGARDIFRQQYRTTPQALSDIPGVSVQETAQGHGSPYIRGFTSFRNLFLIDGIRLNNSVFRPGPNQYWNTVDPFLIDRIELVKGPSSVLYGSDAIGGTANVMTTDPYADAGTLAGTGTYRYSSAEDSHAGRGEVSAVSPDRRVGVVGGGTYREFGDLEIGDGEQDNTRYSEWHSDLKVEHFLSDKLRVVGAYQIMRQNNVPRTHKTVFAEPFAGTTVGTELRRELDQERELAYIQAHGFDLDGPVDRFSASVSWHRQSELRDRIKGNGDRDLQGFEVNQLGFFANATSTTPIGELTYGVDYYRDFVSAFSSTNDIQGPVADDATYDLFGAFIQNRIDVTRDLVLLVGGRFTYAAASAGSVNVNNEEQSLEDDFFNLAGNARFAWFLDEPRHWNIFGGVSQGFRAPNLSDLTRDTDFGGGVERPAPGLDPENYVMFEIGAKGQYDDLTLQTSFFHYLMFDRIIRVDTGPGDVFNKINSDDGFMQGVEFGAAWRFAPDVTLFGNFAYFDGEVQSIAPSGETVDDYPSRLPPTAGQVGLRYEPFNLPFWAEAEVDIVARADRLSFRDKADDQRIPPGGTPGYVVGSIRGGWDIAPNASLSLALENLSDADHRVHGSGQNRPGRNVIVSFRGSF